MLMKASLIALRVADFLKNFPPFDGIPGDDLLDLVSRSKVKFHESEEELFRQGEDRGSFFWVIREGRVELRQQRHGESRLSDLRAEGDLLGMGWLMGEKTYHATAITQSDCLLYAIPRAHFENLLQKYPAVARFLTASFSLKPHFLRGSHSSHQDETPENMIRGKAFSWLEESEPLRERSRKSLMTVAPTTPIRDVAARMARRKVEAAVVVTQEGHPLGMITDTDFRLRIATGKVGVTAPASDLMSVPVFTAPAGREAGEYLLMMMEKRCRHLCLTQRGTTEETVEGLLAERDVILYYGNNPMVVLREIQRCQSYQDLNHARQLAEDVVLGGLHYGNRIDWFSNMMNQINEAIFFRVLELASLEAGVRKEDMPTHSWLFFGASGRKEHFSRFQLYATLIWEENGATTEQKQALQLLGETVKNGLATCGYRDHPWESLVTLEVIPAEEFRSRLLKPFDHLEDKNPPAFSFAPFDFRHIAGDPDLSGSIRAELSGKLLKHPGFLNFLARDSLRFSPPLTVFQNFVIDSSGQSFTELNLYRSLIQPLVSCSRLLAYSFADHHHLGTAQRLILASQHYPDLRDNLTEAANAFRLCLFFKIRSGIQFNDSGDILDVAKLNRYERELLKSAFRSTLALMENIRLIFLEKNRTGDEHC